jgi:hypothetical protein
LVLGRYNLALLMRYLTSLSRAWYFMATSSTKSLGFSVRGVMFCSFVIVSNHCCQIKLQR